MAYGTFPTTVHSSVVVGLASTLIAAENPKRRSLCLTNNTVADIWLAVGAAAVIGAGYLLAKGGGIVEIEVLGEFDKGYRAAIYGIDASGVGGRSIGVAEMNGGI